MAESKNINLVVITPEREVVRETATAVVIPAHDGEIGVLNLRAPLMCELGIGQLRYETDGHARRVFIDGGFAQVHDNDVAVLTPNALLAEQVTAEVVENARRALDEADVGSAERVLQQRRLSTLSALQSTS